ncbi:MAG: hypothetical protein E7069_12095 [Bacteroidales bacterium]|nr:hypothetical protein [Bacteroidales bacterium]
MIYTIEIDVPNKERWGEVITYDFVMPSNIHHIRGVLGNVLLREKTYFKRLQAIEKGELEVHNPYSVQIGVFSISLGNTNIVSANVPLCAIAELRKSGYKHNLVKTDRISVPTGELARIVIEEQHKTPFVGKQLFYKSDGEFYSKLAKAYFDTDKESEMPVFTNSYTAKIYIDYD